MLTKPNSADEQHRLDPTTQTRDLTTLTTLTAPKGRFDAHEAPGFSQAFTAMLERGARAITVDLAEVVFIDSTALAELVRAQRVIRSNGGSLRLANPTDAVRVILELTGLASIFAVIPASPFRDQ